MCCPPGAHLVLSISILQTEMMKLALLLALPAAYAVPGIPRSGLPHQMDADAKITAALRRAAGLSDVSDAPLLSAAVAVDQAALFASNAPPAAMSPAAGGRIGPAGAGEPPPFFECAATSCSALLQPAACARNFGG